VRFSHLETDDVETRAPDAGVSFQWQRTRGRLEATAAIDSRIGWLETDDGTMEERERRLGYGASGSIGGGDVHRVRSELSLGFSGSEVRLDQEPILELPDLGFLDGALAAEDLYSARLDLQHRNDGTSLNGWVRWHRRDSEPVDARNDSTSEILAGSVHYSTRGFGIQGSGGRSTVERETQADQEVLHGALAVRWRPWWPLSTSLTYALDRRTLTMAPDVDGSRLELSAELQLGNLRLHARLYETEDDVENDGSRFNRGFRWSISSRFGGLLPVYSGTKRKGVIR
jgi:hypothetical protein